MDWPGAASRQQFANSGGAVLKQVPGAMLDDQHQSRDAAGHTWRRIDSTRPAVSPRQSNSKPAPAQSSLSFSVLLSLLVVLVALSLVQPAAAHVDLQRSAALPLDDLDWSPSLLIVDTRPPPIPVPQLMHLQRRDDATTASASATLSTATIQTDPSATPSATDIPKPFDTVLSNNFTQKCANFLEKFLSNDTFNSCHPFSLLLQTSSGFFDASKSFVRITGVLEATCDVNAQVCTNVMNDLARQLRDNNNCGVDWNNNNPQILQAYNGLIAYEPLYQASCLRDPDGSYCYANAITNTSSTTDAYPYYLPLGVALPGGSRPTCNSCLQNTMAIFSAEAGNATQPISKTYDAAAAQVDVYCGPTFVNKTATPVKGAAPGTTVPLVPTFALLIMLVSHWI